MNHKLTVFTATILTLLYVVTTYAGKTNDFINSEIASTQKMLKEFLNKDDLTKYKKISIQKIQGYQETVENIKTQYMEKLKAKGIKQVPQAMVFVSFSMPELSLKQIIRDGARYQIPVVIRGLYKNSFRKTMEKIFELVKEDNQGGILINPRWFKEYGIKAVPAMVISKNNNSNKNTDQNNYDVILGNIPIKKALSIVAERGDVANVAKNILEKNKI